MEKFIRKESRTTPEIILDPTTHVFTMKGESRPEDVRGFYDPMMTWLTEYQEAIIKGGMERPDVMMVEVFLDYFNSSSAKFLIEIISKFTTLHHEEGVALKINWVYEDEDYDILEAGEEISDMLDFPFKYTKMDV